MFSWNKTHLWSPCRWVPQTWSKLCRISAWPAEDNILPLRCNQGLQSLPRLECILMSCKRTHCSKLSGNQQFEHSPIWNLSRLKKKYSVLFLAGSVAPHSFYFMIKLSYMNDLARNWKYRVRGIIYKLENKYIKPGLLHFWLLTFLWHFYKMTSLQFKLQQKVLQTQSGVRVHAGVKTGSTSGSVSDMT